MNIALNEIKDEIRNYVDRKVNDLKLKKKVNIFKEKIRKAEKKLNKNMNKFDLKKRAKEMNKEKTKAKKVDPFIAAIVVLGGIFALFFSLISVFFGFYSFLHKKKEAGYLSVTRFPFNF